MNTRADTLRSTLDHLALDPRAKDDRKYLVSMLRRLGYTEQQIREVVGAAVEDEPRIIEIEYRKGRSGSGAFSVVDEDDVETVGFSVTEGRVAEPGGDPAVGHGWIPMDGDVSARAPDIDNPWETDEEDWATEEPAVADSWDPPVEFTERAAEDATAWPEQAEDVEPWTLQPEEATAWPEADVAEDDAWPTRPEDEPWGFDSKDAGTLQTTVEPDEEAWEEAPEAEAEPVEAWADVPEEPVADVSDDYQVKDAPAGAWTAEEAWVPAEEDIQEAEEAVDEIQPFAYGEYGLYTRMVDLSTGRQQRIYFFAKSEPRSGRPCAMPDGYIVEENLRTGLPFLRRDPNAAEAPEEAAPAPTVSHEQCTATTKHGLQCKKSPLEGTAFCNIHKGRA